VVDITGDVEKAIIDSEIMEGFALVYSPHTTCGVMVNERETGLLADIRSTLGRLVPEEDGYRHDDFNVRTENLHPGETKNAHAHLRHLIGGKASEYIPISGGSLLLGQWQRVMVIEFDRAREREILLQICGT
jgi:secondary thiamine-phosphate synthase enzyme